MSLLSFSMFLEKIENGAKTHTIRFRKKAPQVGDTLFLWWKSRTKDRKMIGLSVCTRVDYIAINSEIKTVAINNKKLQKPTIAKLAKSDGFNSTANFWDYFKKINAVGFLIHWDPDLITKKAIRSEVQIQSVGKIDPADLTVYRPSDSSESIGFQAFWCEQCARGGKHCWIELNELTNVSTGFWTQTKDDAICLGFIPKTSSLAQVYKKRESQGQLNLLDLVH